MVQVSQKTSLRNKLASDMNLSEPAADVCLQVKHVCHSRCSSVTLSDTEARDALAEWVKNYGGCCTSQGAAKKMEVTAVKPVMFRVRVVATNSAGAGAR